MTETAHTRSRRASLGGLIVQLIAFAATLTLSQIVHSGAIYNLAWYVLGGVPVWFVALLVFRQRELAALEALDLEELRRERRRTGGGEALFEGDEAGGLGFRVAESRLAWMLRWLVPGFGLATALYLAIMAIVLWRLLTVSEVIRGVRQPGLRIGGEGWPPLDNVPIGMVVLAIVMLGTFLLSRYTSGMARVKEWQLLRGCGSFLLGNVLVIVAVLVSLGVELYAGVRTWEQTLSFAIPVIMMILSLEIGTNLVLDIYRPRSPDVEARASFDSRLLGLLAEPGGIASSIAEAINYQFGFQVSHTWFYQLLERAFVPLLAVGALVLWLLTCIVVVQPYEHVIIERFGRQLNPGGPAAPPPYGPGLRFKWPWPIERARAYNTGELHEIHVGYEIIDAQPDYEHQSARLLLWTDTQHLGQTHFDFLISPPPRAADSRGPDTRSAMSEFDETAPKEDAPVHLIRMDVAVQYQISPDRLLQYTRVMRDPHEMLRNIAWEGLSRMAASLTAEDLLSADLAALGRELRVRVDERVAELGLEAVYVGVTNVHPEKSVAEAYRNVVKAEQERVADIRAALVQESERLSQVAGDERRARELANAVSQNRLEDTRIDDAQQRLAGFTDDVLAPWISRLEEHTPAFGELVAARARLAAAQDQQDRVALEFELGLGQTTEQRDAAIQRVTAAEAAVAAARAALRDAVASIRAAAAEKLNSAAAEALVQLTEARVAREFWQARLAQGFSPAWLEGESASILAQALANRWQEEMQAAGDVTVVRNEREAYRAAPKVYKARRLMEVLVNGIKNARKYFLAFDPEGRTVRVRFISGDSLRLDPMDVTTEMH